MVRVRPETHRRLADLAKELDKPLGEVLDLAVEQYRRAAILAATDRAYSVSHATDDAVWDATIADGLEPE